MKGDITYLVSHNYANIKVDSYNYLPLEKKHVAITLIKSAFNKYKNSYCYSLFLEKLSYELPKKKFCV